ncbi:hypothetical protein [Variovorax sp. J31P207]|uniref:hypothetical protein n=1 Tax=Variovorax sp. J31P207 TaxID=3053510 RepID=UPI00257788C5|nr:hypothetical protein [Variovorax sp. J31P207]MDM0065956.1 hypothetical protein [Variovorax sp. J31P207]
MGSKGFGLSKTDALECERQDRHAAPSLSLRQRRLPERDRSERATQLPLPLRIGPPPSLPRSRDEALFRGIRRIGDQVVFVEPTGIDIAVPLDLPRQGVPDGPRTLDLAPHAGRNLELLREGLVQALGRQPGGDCLFEKAPMEQQRIAATDDGEREHCSKTTTRQEKIVEPVDVAVKTIYSPLPSRPKPHEFHQRKQEPT